jgi:hypothetical protein
LRKKSNFLFFMTRASNPMSPGSFPPLPALEGWMPWSFQASLELGCSRLQPITTPLSPCFRPPFSQTLPAKAAQKPTDSRLCKVKIFITVLTIQPFNSLTFKRYALSLPISLPTAFPLQPRKQLCYIYKCYATRETFPSPFFDEPNHA